MATGIQDILGNHPIPGSATYEGQVRRVARKWLELCPIRRKTTYYFDATNGDDDTGDGSQDNPWQTVAKMNSVAADDVALKLKAGEVWRGTTTLTVKGASLSAYGSGPAPVISGFTQLSNSGGSNWTQATTTDRYTASLTTLGWSGVGWLREQGADWGKVYKKAASTTEVENNDFSWFISGDTISVNCGGVDPDTVSLESTAAAAAANDGITIDRSGGRIDGVVAAGQACEDDTGAAYGIKITINDEEVACCTNVECYYHAVHNWGATNATDPGGRTLLMNATLGWCASSGVGGVTPHVAYAADGENQHIAINVDVPYGQLPENVTRAYGKGRALYGHTNGGSNKVGAMHFIDCKVPLGSTYAPAQLGFVGNAPDASTLAAVRCVFHKCTAAKTPGAASPVCTSGNAYVACHIETDPMTVFDSAGALSVNENFEGYLLSSYYEFDLTNSSATRLAIANPSSSQLAMLPKIANSHIHVIGNGTTDAPWFNHDYYTGTTSPNDSTIFNSLFTATGMGTGAAIPATGNLDPNTADTNAFFGFDSTDTNRGGYDHWNNSVELDGEPNPSELMYRGKTTVSILPEVDLLGRPLATPGEAIGPYGRPAETLTADDAGIERGNLVAQLGELYEVANNPTAIKAFQDLYPQARFIEGDGQRAYARLGGERDLP